MKRTTELKCERNQYNDVTIGSVLLGNLKH